MAAVSDTLETRLSLVGLDTYTSGLTRAAAAMGLLEGKLSSAAQKSLDQGVLAGAGAAAIGVGIYKSVEAAGRLEQIKIAFETIEGSAEAADKRISELQAFAANTPFDFEQTTKAAQQLRAMGVAGDKLLPTMQAVGEAISAAGGSNEDFTGALRAIGQIQTKGKLSQEELNQLAERGVPAMRILARELGLTQQQLQNIGANGIESGKALDALTRGLQKDFGGAMEKQSRTLFGSLSNLTDNVNQAMAALGKVDLGPVTSVVQGVSGMIGKFNELPEAAKSGIGAVVTVLGMGLAVKSALAFYQLARLTTENTRLQNESLKSAKAAKAQAAAEDQLANSANRAADALNRRNRAAGAVPIGGNGGGSVQVSGPAAPGQPAPADGNGKGGGSGLLGGLKGLVITTAIEAGISWVNSKIPEPSNENFNGRGMEGLTKSTLPRIGKRAATGAGIGALLGPQGAAIGGLLGGLEGIVEDMIVHPAGDAFREPANKPGDKKLTPEQERIKVLEAQLAEQQKQTALLKGIHEQGAFNSAGLGRRQEVGALEFGRLVS